MYLHKQFCDMVVTVHFTMVIPVGGPKKPMMTHEAQKYNSDKWEVWMNLLLTYLFNKHTKIQVKLELYSVH